MSEGHGNIRHEFISMRLDGMQATGVIDGYRYEKAAQRYLVTLPERIDVAGGADATDTLVLTLMSAEAFLAGVTVMQRAGFGGRVFTVNSEGVVDVE